MTLQPSESHFVYVSAVADKLLCKICREKTLIEVVSHIR